MSVARKTWGGREVMPKVKPKVKPSAAKGASTTACTTGSKKWSDSATIVSCGVCGAGIAEGIDEAIQCEGRCQKWIHRHCAGITKTLFEELAGSSKQFACLYCSDSGNKEVIESLKAEVSVLRAEITELKTIVMALTTSGPAARCQTSSDPPICIPGIEGGETLPGPLSYLRVIKAGASPSMPQPIPKTNPDKKYNIVLYGVDECGPGMTKTSRQESDLTTVATVLSSVDSSIESWSIRDCFRLGKFSKGARPRPLLVKFVRVSDVNKILSKARLIPKPYVLKPDMSLAQRIRDSVILKERWKLIQSGIERKNIKIKNDCLYVNNQLHGRTVNQTFQIDSSSPSGFCTTEMSDVETTPKNLLIVQEHSTSATATFLTPPQNDDCTPTQAPHSIQQSESPPVAPRRKDPQVSNNQPKL